MLHLLDSPYTSCSANTMNDEQGSQYLSREERERPLILMADDDPEIRRLLSLFFEDRDVDIIETSDGAQALEAVLVHDPNLVILDVMMPELNGWQVCKYIKSKPELAAVKVIMLTAIGPVNNELTSPIFGADDYVDKPFNFDEMGVKVDALIGDAV